VAYQFVPRDLFITKNDKINLHWTGSQTNNRRNDGRGTAKHDLHSITTHNGTNCLITNEQTPSVSFQQLIENPKTCSLIGWQHLGNGLPMISLIHIISSSKLNTNSESSAALTMDHDEINFISDKYQFKVQELSPAELENIDSDAFTAYQSDLSSDSSDIYRISPGNSPLEAKIIDENAIYYLWNPQSLSWKLLPKENDDAHLIANSLSGILVRSKSFNPHLQLYLSLAGVVLAILLIGSTIMVFRRPDHIQYLLGRENS
jgi:hypothetical protein